MHLHWQGLGHYVFSLLVWLYLKKKAQHLWNIFKENVSEGTGHKHLLNVSGQWQKFKGTIANCTSHKLKNSYFPKAFFSPC